MPDNVPILDATNTSTPIASDDVAGVQFQRVKLDVGGDGASVPVVGALPVSDAGGSLTVDGTVAVSNFPATQPVSIAAAVAVTGPATDAQLRATPLPISGTVTVSNPTAAGLTDAQLRATPVPVSGTVTVANPTAQGLTDAQLRASAVPVSLASLPLPTNAATVAGQDAATAILTTIDEVTGLIASRTPELFTTIPTDTTAAPPVRQVPADLWRTSFADSGAGVPSSELTLRQTGAGMTVNQSASSLVITTGTTTNAETVIRSDRTFRGAHIMRYRVILSQRIVNQHFELALADTVGESLAYTINSTTSVTVTFPTVNPFTALSVGQFVNLGQLSSVGIPGRYAIASVSGLTVTFTVASFPASGSGTLTLWGHTYHRIAYTGATATNASYDAQRRGWASGDTTVTISTTASPGHVGQLHSIGHTAGYSDALVASNAAYQFTARASRLENLPDDQTLLNLWIIARNGNTAPASTTTLTIGFVSVEMTGRQKVYISGADQVGGPLATPVQIMGGSTAVTGTITANIGTGALAAGTNAIGDVGIQYRTSTTGAASFATLVSAATTNATIIKGTPGRLLGYCLTNNATAVRYVKFHNQTTLPTAGTGAIHPVGIPPNGGKVFMHYPGGVAFATGIGITTVTGAAAADNTAVALNDIVGTIHFA